MIDSHRESNYKYTQQTKFASENDRLSILPPDKWDVRKLYFFYDLVPLSEATAEKMPSVLRYMTPVHRYCMPTLLVGIP